MSFVPTTTTSTRHLPSTAGSTAAESTQDYHTPCTRRPGRWAREAAFREAARCGLHSECARFCGTRGTSWTTRPLPGTALSRSTSLKKENDSNERHHLLSVRSTLRETPAVCCSNRSSPNQYTSCRMLTIALLTKAGTSSASV